MNPYGCPVPRIWLATEFSFLFFGVVGGYALVGSPGNPVPLIVVAGVAALAYLRRQPTFDRHDLTRPQALKPVAAPMLGRWAVAALTLVAALAVAAPGRLFDLPREQPRLWAMVVVLYPLLSVYPQEVVYRAFLLHRYRPLFGAGHAAAVASTAAFGFAHVIYGSALSVALTLLLGWFLTRRYQRTRSLLTTSVEHALYGVLAFTIGLGDFFYHDAG